MQQPPNTQDLCEFCHSELNPPEETKSGKKLQRCSKGKWNPEKKVVEGCLYVKWLNDDKKVLDEKCPKCGNPLVMMTTRTKKKMKKCSTSGWDRENMVATGCDYVEWVNDSNTPLDEDCPLCGNKLVLFITKNGKKMKKCSTAGWDREFRQPTGCTHIEWMND